MFAASSCVQQSKYNELLEQLDTLTIQKARNEQMMTELQTYIDEITMSLDSIAYQESILFLPDPETPNKSISKNIIRKRLDAFQELVDRQQLRISILEDSLNINNTNLRSIKSLLGHMQEQIEQKNIRIEQLKKDILNKDTNIKKLKTTVASLESDINTLNESVNDLQQQTKEQQDILIIQNDMMNEAFMLMGNKKELTSLGAITGGKASSNPDLNNFIRVDIRYFTELEIPSSKPKIITTMPASAYTITNNGNGTSILKILNPTEFWKTSKILIIQLR